MYKKLFINFSILFFLLFTFSIEAQSLNGNRSISFQIGLKEKIQNSYERLDNSYFIDFEFKLPIINYFDINMSTMYSYGEGEQLSYYFIYHYPPVTNTTWQYIYINKFDFGLELNFYYTFFSKFCPFIDIGYVYRYSEKKHSDNPFRNDSIVELKFGLEYFRNKIFNSSFFVTYRRFYDIPGTELHDINMLLSYRISNSSSIKIELFQNLDIKCTGGGLGFIFNI